MTDDEEREFYNKYIRPQYRLIQRIKRKILGPRKRVKTIKDFDTLEFGSINMMVNVILIIMIIVVTLMAIERILDIYRWFFPVKENIPNPIPFFKELIANA